MAFHYKPPHSKTWRIGFYDDITKKPRSISAKTRSEAEAKRKAKDFSAERRLNIQQEQYLKTRDRSIKLSEGLELYFSQKKLKPNTIQSYKLAVKQFISVTGDKYLYRYSRIDGINFNNYLNNHTRKGTKNTQQHISQNTKANYTRHLYSLFHWFVKNKLIKENIIEKFKIEKKQVETIPPEELKTIFKAFEGVNLKKNRDLIMLKYFAAYRAEELLSAKTEDFNFNTRIVKISNLKANRVDEIPMVDDLYQHLQQMDLPKSGKITKLNYQGLRSVFRRVQARLIKKNTISNEYTLHQLRKSRGTDLANQGISPLFLHKFMRHENIKTTMDYYIKVDLQKMAAEINSKLEI